MADAQRTVNRLAAIVGELATALAVARAERDEALARLAGADPAADATHGEADPTDKSSDTA